MHNNGHHSQIERREKPLPTTSPQTREIITKQIKKRNFLENSSVAVQVKENLSQIIKQILVQTFY